MVSALRRTHQHQAAVAAAALVAAGGLLVPVGPAVAATQAGAQLSTATLTQVTLAASRPTLRQGARGAAVTNLQRRLTALHYDVGGVDGVFGYSTFHAVVAFQKVNNLSRDGIVGPKTWAALDHPATLKPRYNHSGYSVEAILSKQVLILAKQGQVVRIVDASSGKASTPTVLGNYSVKRRVEGWDPGPLGNLYRPNYFTGGYAVHGATSVPNYPASHGCVRVTVPAMNRLWSILRIGTPVHVYR